MLDSTRGSIQGFVKIIDTDTKEILVDTHNDVLYGNISLALAQSLIGNSDNFLSYIAFGNGGAYVGTTGAISYKSSMGGQNSLAKNPRANLYNTIYVKKISNNSTSTIDINPTSKSYIPAENFSTNYEDIIIDVTLSYLEPSTAISQSLIDNSAFLGYPGSTTTSGQSTSDTFVFNEIGLFAGSAGDSIFSGSATATANDVNNFVNQSLSTSGVASKLMLTHVIFHPIQKTFNRSIEIIYTLRIQMGTVL